MAKRTTPAKPAKTAKAKAPAGAAPGARELARLRAAIDAVDGRLLDALNERARLVIEVGKVKETLGGAFYVPSREEDLVRGLSARNAGPFPESGIRPVWKEIISASLSLEHKLTVAYLGPQATFSHQACLKQFGLSAGCLPVRSIAEVFDAVEKKKADYGVIPVENTTEGAVNYTLDRFLDSEVKIVGEVLLRVSHNLMNLSGRREEIARVYSHPQALAQCRGWLETHLPDAVLFDAPSTTQAARTAAAEADAAAIAGPLAADLYGLKVVEARIEDNPNNFTRFLVIGREIPPPAENNKTSLLFSVKDQAGALYHMLRPFHDNRVNLTKIESRPLKRKAWEYVFFVDCEGHVAEPAVGKAIRELEGVCQFLKVLGSYPRAASAD